VLECGCGSLLCEAASGPGKPFAGSFCIAHLAIAATSTLLAESLRSEFVFDSAVFD
jgi:hypothetical protein